MKLLRVSVVAAAALLLGGGYLASQSAFLNNTASQYAGKIDTPIIRVVALVILVVCIALVIFQKSSEDDSS